MIPQAPIRGFLQGRPIYRIETCYPRMQTFSRKFSEQSTCRAFSFEAYLLCRLHGPFYQTNLRTTGRWPWPWTTISSRSYWTLSKALEPRWRLVEQNSSFWVAQALYPKFFKAPPLDEQVLATINARGPVSAATVIDHRKVVEGLYEAFMATFRTNWHASVLVCFFFETAQDRTSRDVALYLYRALVEQWVICLKGAASSISLIRHEAVETSTLRNWTPLRSRLAPIPFKGGLLFDSEILQQVDCLDKEEEQLKKARSFGSRPGYLSSIFRGHSRGGSTTQSPAPLAAPTSQQSHSSSRGGH